MHNRHSAPAEKLDLLPLVTISAEPATLSLYACWGGQTKRRVVLTVNCAGCDMFSADCTSTVVLHNVLPATEDVCCVYRAVCGAQGQQAPSVQYVAWQQAMQPSGR